MVLKFDPYLYPEKAIRTAVRQYSKAVDISLKKSRGMFEVRMTQRDGEHDPLLKHEFKNYLLGLSRKCL